MKSYKLEYKGKILDLAQPKIMGILNVTPDSFSDGGKYVTVDAALEHARDMMLAGAAVIDVGGESTRRESSPVTTQEELDRVVPVVEAIAASMDIWISVDTSNPEVMKAALDAGACMINDVRALRRDGAIETVAEYGCPVCIQHMIGEDPQVMQQNASYSDLIGDISTFLYERIHICLNAGVRRDNLMIDPGFGFGKNLEQNYRLLGQLDRFKSFGLPILVGLSRKSMIGDLLKVNADSRLAGSIAANLFAVGAGADILRVHDVKEMAEALKVYMYAMKFSKQKIKK
ncbi:MAG: dihydropteroate synthase [Succinivibrionaceae bacterium]|nr:dihydropteroate synthase [Succinivibrionaceae bacterium]